MIRDKMTFHFSLSGEVRKRREEERKMRAGRKEGERRETKGNRKREVGRRGR